MAVTPTTDKAFLREVDEELRRDQAAQLWQRYGRVMIGAVVAGLLAFGGYLIWQNYNDQAAGAQGAKLTDVFETLGKGDVKAAEKPLAELAASSSDGYAASARFVQGDIALQKQDLKGAAKIFGAIANDAGLSSAFRNLALIRQTNAEFDTLKPETVIARLKPLAVKGNPWFGSAGELVAIAYLQTNRRDLAGKLYAAMAEEETLPETLRTRAVQMAGTLGVDAVKDSKDMKPQ